MTNKTKAKPGFGRVLVAVAAIPVCILALANVPPSSSGGEATASGRSSVNAGGTYRLIQAVGDVEHESGRGLSRADCEVRKAELKRVAEALGTHNERTGFGSITCLSERDSAP